MNTQSSTGKMKAACLLVCLGLVHGIVGSIFKPQQLEELITDPLQYIGQQQKQQQQPEDSQYVQTQQDKLQQEQSQEVKRHQELQESQYKSQKHQQTQSEESHYQKSEGLRRHLESQSYERQYKHEQLKPQQSEDYNTQRHQQSEEWQYKNQKPRQSEETQYQNQRHQRSEESQYQARKYQQSEELRYQPLGNSQQEQQPGESQYIPQYHHSHYQQQQKESHHRHTPKPSKHSHYKKSSESSSSESHESKEKRYNVVYTSPLQTGQWNSLDTTVVAYDMGQGIGDMIWQGQMPVVPSHVTDRQTIEMIFADAEKAMNHIKPEDKVRFHEAYEVTTQKENEDKTLNFTQLVKKHQYNVEEHIVKTDDGYLLNIFRIPPKQQTRTVQKSPVVFLMHGILGSADDWVLMGPGKSLAYLLSDAGYDVWLGNARGNKYSRNHVSKHPAVSDFWQFSIDEIALQDLPAMIDYTLQNTNQEKLSYIGHSLGTTTLFALTAAQPKYNDKIIMMYALSPAVFMKNARSPLVRMIAPTSEFYKALKNHLGHGAFNPDNELIKVVGGAMCEKEIGCKEVCSNINFVMGGVNVEGLDSEVIPMILSHMPAGGSTKMMKHYGQAVAFEEFKKYDHGPVVNERVYGSPEPPKYDMKLVRMPVTLYYSEEDWLAHPKDVERLQNELPNVNEAVKVPDVHFNYLDFQFSKKAPEIVYKHLIDSLDGQHQ